MIKIEKMLDREWPNHKIQVHLFGYCYVMFIVIKDTFFYTSVTLTNYYL
jgi:hypothetical protein